MYCELALGGLSRKTTVIRGMTSIMRRTAKKRFGRIGMGLQPIAATLRSRIGTLTSLSRSDLSLKSCWQQVDRSKLSEELHPVFDSITGLMDARASRVSFGLLQGDSRELQWGSGPGSLRRPRNPSAAGAPLLQAALRAVQDHPEAEEAAPGVRGVRPPGCKPLKRR